MPTLFVALAVATMIGLGVWQLQRAEWKEGLLARYTANHNLAPVAFPAVPGATDPLLFRRTAGFCVKPVAIRAAAGRNADGVSGWSHIVTCRNGGKGAPEMTVDLGWSESFDTPINWRGGSIAGIIAPDSNNRVRLVATEPAPGLLPSQPPGTEAISNNHRMYAVQWFFFAAAAALIYWRALRKRSTTPRI